jgi:hypothetical protein
VHHLDDVAPHRQIGLGQPRAALFGPSTNPEGLARSLFREPSEFAVYLHLAFSMAGGTNAFASETRIRIIRPMPDGQQQVIRFDLEEVKAGRALDSNVLLQSGDTIVVPGASLF